MKIPAVLQPLLDTGRRDLMSLLQRMQPGDTFSARVLALPQKNLVQLLIGGTRLLADTRIPLQVGDRLTLNVAKGLPQLQLTLARPPSAAQPAKQLLADALPRQLNPTRQLALAQEIKTTNTTARPASAPAAATTELAQRIVDAISGRSVGTTTRAPTAEQIRTAFQHSGLFFEPSLLTGHPIAKDHKFELLQFLRLLTPQKKDSTGREVKEETAATHSRSAGTGAEATTGRLLRLLEAALSRIQTNQANSMPHEDGAPRQAWLFDLPLTLGEKFQYLKMSIARDEEHESGDRPVAWQVNIHFDFDNLGRIDGRITLSGEQVSTVFWCENDQTRRLFEQRMGELDDKLQAAGLDVGNLVSRTGNPPDDLTPPIPLDTLLDEKA